MKDGGPWTTTYNAALFDDVRLRHYVEETRDMVTKLSHVIQGEQERVGALEAAVCAQRSRLTESEQTVTKLSTRADESIFSLADVRKVMASCERRLDFSESRLNGHDGDVGGIIEGLAGLSASDKAARERLASLEGTTIDLRAALEDTNAEARRQAAQLAAGDEATGRLAHRVGEAEARAASLHAAHEDTSSKLRQTVDQVIVPALEQAEAERARLGSALARIACTEEAGSASAEQAARLAADLGLRSMELGETTGLLGTTVNNVRDLNDAHARANDEARLQRELLEVAQQRMHRLEQALVDSTAMLRKAREDAADALEDCRRRSAQVDSLASEVAALRAGVEATDGEVGDIRALLSVPRAGDDEFD
eukprot:TRINITY_DN69846_c0_g1_i1.p1 TRINITY_DN69846_c0_g1~~TRINITY_DN69846_c0_g1_i1.p1  ORF type:complete len:395 (+),score=92.46 TRINITY_DN69846_c0_g1_i1:85-1185(+)